MWQTGIESNRGIARKRKRRLHYVSNIYVIHDPKQPNNEGRVFLFKYGISIFDKITDKLSPECEGDGVVNVFDVREGANFKLRVRKVEGFVNYQKSEFDTPSPLATSDDQMEAMWSQEHSLVGLADAKEFKAVAVLQERFNAVPLVSDRHEPEAAAIKKDVGVRTNNTPSSTDSDSDQAIDYFRKLAEED